MILWGLVIIVILTLQQVFGAMSAYGLHKWACTWKKPNQWMTYWALSILNILSCGLLGAGNAVYYRNTTITGASQ